MAPINEANLGSGGNPFKALKAFVSMVVVMNTSSVSTTFLLNHASFHKFLFLTRLLNAIKKTLV